MKCSLRPAGLLAVMAAVLLTACNGSPEYRAARFIQAGKQHFESGDYSRALLQFFNAMEATPKAAEPYYRVALTYIAAGDMRDGIVYLQKAVRKDPMHMPSQVKLCELMLMSTDEERTAEAKQKLLDVVHNSPDDVDALTALALAEWQMQNPAAAEQYLRHALGRFPDNMKPVVALARMKLGQGDLNGAEQVLRDAAGHKPASAPALVALAELLVLTGRIQEAEQELHRATQVDPKNAPALLNLAALHHRAGRTEEAEAVYKRISALGSRYRAVHPNYLFGTGKKQQALREFERLHQDGPEDREARTRLVSAYVAMDRLLDAQKVISVAVEKNRKDVEALLQRAGLRTLAGDFAGAQADITEVLRFRPESAEAHFVLSQVHAKQGSIRLQKLELSEALRLNSSLLAARTELAEALLRSNEGKTALELMESAPAEQKHSLPVVLQKNRILLALGDTALLDKTFDQELAGSRIPAVLRQKALFKLAQRDYEGARAATRDALAQNPEDVESLGILVRSYALRSDLGSAVREIQEYVSRRPQSAPLQHFLGQTLVLTGDREQARKAFVDSHAADPTFVPAGLALAQIDAQAGNLDSAKSILKEMVSREPQNVPARLLLAQTERAGRNFDAAIAHARAVLETDPRNIAALNNIAFWMAETNRQDEAFPYAQKAKELAPDQASVADTIGWVLYRKGLFSTAVGHLEDAVAKDPTPARRYHLAVAYFKAGQEQRGREMLRSALRMDAAAPEAVLAREIIEGQAR